MKKLAILAAALAVLTAIFCTVAVSADATEWENPFTDVAEGAWYYDAVAFSNQNGIFNGTTATTFSPTMALSRAQFVKALTGALGVEVPEYETYSFTDVEPGSWYADAVEWAYQSEIVSGVGEGLFGVKNPITRQDMVVIFHRVAKANGYDTTVATTFKYDRLADADEIGSWAEEALKWAMSNGIVSGTGNEGAFPLVSPRKTATRAAAAQIFKGFVDYTNQTKYPLTSVTFNGNPIDNYVIVYENGNSVAKDAAGQLRTYIFRAYGKRLTVVADTADVTDYEILLGKTNREAKGLVTVDRSSENIESFEITVQGNYVTIAGHTDNDDVEPTYFGMVGFCEEILGYSFYTKNADEFTVYGDVAIEDGYVFKDEPLLEERIAYWSGISDTLRCGERRYTGFYHNIGELTETGEASSDNPCLTSQKNIDTAVKNVRALLKKTPAATAVWVSQNDSETFCSCNECQKVVLEEGSRAGTVIRFCNAIAEAIEADYPDVFIRTYAYHATTIPTKSAPHKNVVIYYCTLDNCASHTYNDPNCSLNISIEQNLSDWGAMTTKVYTWDYSTNFEYCLSIFPTFTTMRVNNEWFYNNNVRGQFNNAVSGSNVGAFGTMRGYLLAKLLWNPLMSDEEYNQLIDGYLEHYYGAGWTYLRKFIDKTEELSDKGHYGYYAIPNVIISDEDMLAWNDTMNGWFDAAEAACESKTELDRVKIERLSLTFMYQCARYERDYVYGNAASRAQYKLDNTNFNNSIGSVRWAESSERAFSAEKPPYKWIMNKGDFDI